MVQPTFSFIQVNVIKHLDYTCEGSRAANELVFHSLHQPHAGLQSVKVWPQNANRCCRRSDWNKADVSFLFFLNSLKSLQFDNKRTKLSSYSGVGVTACQVATQQALSHCDGRIIRWMRSVGSGSIHLYGDHKQLLYNCLLHPLKRLMVTRVGSDKQDQVYKVGSTKRLFMFHLSLKRSCRKCACALEVHQNSSVNLFIQKLFLWLFYYGN